MTALLLSNFPFVIFYTWIHKCNAIEQENNYLSGGNNVLSSLKQLTCLKIHRSSSSAPVVVTCNLQRISRKN